LDVAPGHKERSKDSLEKEGRNSPLGREEKENLKWGLVTLRCIVPSANVGAL